MARHRRLRRFSGVPKIAQSPAYGAISVILPENPQHLGLAGGLRAISILWKALASVRTSKKFCVGVRSPLLDDGSTVPGNAARFFGI
jgi:hypothetical protein